MTRVRAFPFLLLACSCSLACLAQAAVEGHQPQPAVVGNHQWPTEKTVRRGMLLVVFPSDPYKSPSECHVRKIEADRLICDGGRQAGTVEFARDSIATLQKKPRRSLGWVLIQAGLVTGGTGLFCGVDGGPVCLTPTIISLTLIAAGVVELAVEAAHRKHDALPLYEAPPLFPAPQAEGPSTGAATPAANDVSSQASMSESARAFRAEP